MMGASWMSAPGVGFLIAFALADPLTTITPCPRAPAKSTTPPPITVTSQYQPVLTCKTKTHCLRNACRTRLDYSTWIFVSTTIPCDWDGTTSRSTLVTNVHQSITISTKAVTTTIFPSGGSASGSAPWGNSSNTIHKPFTSVIEQSFVIPFHKLGPLAIPGYDGSGLCEDCDNDPSGSQLQVVTVKECHKVRHRSKCTRYVETWVSRAPSSSAQQTTTASASTTAPRASEMSGNEWSHSPAPPLLASAAPSPPSPVLTDILPSPITTDMSPTSAAPPQSGVHWSDWIPTQAHTLTNDPGLPAPTSAHPTSSSTQSGMSQLSASSVQAEDTGQHWGDWKHSVSPPWWNQPEPTPTSSTVSTESIKTITNIGCRHNVHNQQHSQPRQGIQSRPTSSALNFASSAQGSGNELLATLDLRTRMRT